MKGRLAGMGRGSDGAVVGVAVPVSEGKVIDGKGWMEKGILVWMNKLLWGRRACDVVLKGLWI